MSIDKGNSQAVHAEVLSWNVSLKAISHFLCIVVFGAGLLDKVLVKYTSWMPSMKIRPHGRLLLFFINIHFTLRDLMSKWEEVALFSIGDFETKSNISVDSAYWNLK